MRICIPIQFKPEGGGFYFLGYFEDYLKEINWEVTRSMQDNFHVLFTNHWMVPGPMLRDTLKRNPTARIVHRIDGAAQDYGRQSSADDHQASVNRLADLSIFQSKYCRFSTRQKFRIISNYGPVIYNPVDVDLFSPEGKLTILPGKIRAAAITWSTNTLKGSVRIYEIARKCPHIDFFLCGNYPDAPDLPNLHKMGVLERGPLASVLRSCHFLVTFSQNEACPNHVLEALASGLPILYLDSGAMAEVIADCGFPITVQDFASKVNILMKQRNKLSVRSRSRALQQFHPGEVFPKYREAIESVVLGHSDTHRYSLGRRR